MSAPQTPFYPMTHDDAQDLIAAIGDESKLAQAYDSTRTYTKDEHCIYSGKLYKCISTISTAEAWTAAHWEEATVGDELTEHKKDIDAICQTVTGANNNTGHTINSGEYFIANGAKYKANAAIPNGEPWASSADPVSDNDLINALNSNKAKLQKGQLATAGTTLTFSLIDACLVYVSRTTSGLAAVYAVDFWGVKQVSGDSNVANITVSGSTITVTRGSALSGNAFVTVIG